MDKNFSLWCDFIERGFLQEEFAEFLANGAFNGATSNPAIFANALKNPIYQEEIQRLKGRKAKEVYENLAIHDIKMAAKSLFVLWEKNQDNGYISLEIDPFLGDKVGESVDEGRRLYKSINMPNVMIKVPATSAGYEVMEALMGDNIAVNATLIFDKNQTKECFEAFARGRKKGGRDDVRGVISVFVSRFDRAVDSMLGEEMQARLGILNAQECYEYVENNGGGYTRTLFASTGVKGEAMPKDYYIKELMHPHSINTAPLESIKAYLEHGRNDGVGDIRLPARDFRENLAKIKEELAQKGMVYEDLTKKLLSEGLNAFEVAFEMMLKSL
ncbi:transaldolase [Helicobacter anatolicus]|uniref:transaldolase n=1 Tax=Helicobacter anatolicus TaxID=2905874 RepID=UPI001E4403A6|nr:transaldolase [Helicobacter anatolicus]MCE3038348.1 transaldolase [Helicobacter anatolicus]